METRIDITEDGSHTLFVPGLNERYHSLHGAVTESMVVFIRAGFDIIKTNASPVRIFEMGFGTGLNAFLTLIRSQESGQKIHYTAIEKFPLSSAITGALNYEEVAGKSGTGTFQALQNCGWNEQVLITPGFTLRKICGDILNADLPKEEYDLIYWDAFGPEVQPELWTEALLGKALASLKQGGIFVTYSAKGALRRILKNEGMEVERLQGPPGKREITRATKK